MQNAKVNFVPWLQAKLGSSVNIKNKRPSRVTMNKKATASTGVVNKEMNVSRGTANEKVNVSEGMDRGVVNKPANVSMGAVNKKSSNTALPASTNKSTTITNRGLQFADHCIPTCVGRVGIGNTGGALSCDPCSIGFLSTWLRWGGSNTTTETPKLSAPKNVHESTASNATPGPSVTSEIFRPSPSREIPELNANIEIPVSSTTKEIPGSSVIVDIPNPSTERVADTGQLAKKTQTSNTGVTRAENNDRSEAPEPTMHKTVARDQVLIELFCWKVGKYSS